MKNRYMHKYRYDGKKENPKSEGLTSDDMRKAGIEGEMRGGDDGSGRAIGG
jgi:hypothetical protein